MRGRVQCWWRCSNQTRADQQRNWLDLQLQGRSFVAPVSPKVVNKGGEFVTIADVAFDTAIEGGVVETLMLSRQGTDPFILSGSWTEKHSCDHEDGGNSCADTVARTVK